MNKSKEDKIKINLFFMILKNKGFCKGEQDLFLLKMEKIKINKDLHFVKKNYNYVRNQD